MTSNWFKYLWISDPFCHVAHLPNLNWNVPILSLGLLNWTRSPRLLPQRSTPTTAFRCQNTCLPSIGFIPSLPWFSPTRHPANLHHARPPQHQRTWHRSTRRLSISSGSCLSRASPPPFPPVGFYACRSGSSGGALVAAPDFATCHLFALYVCDLWAAVRWWKIFPFCSFLLEQLNFLL